MRESGPEYGDLSVDSSMNNTTEMPAYYLRFRPILDSPRQTSVEDLDELLTKRLNHGSGGRMRLIGAQFGARQEPAVWQKCNRDKSGDRASDDRRRAQVVSPGGGAGSSSLQALRSARGLLAVPEWAEKSADSESCKRKPSVIVAAFPYYEVTSLAGVKSGLAVPKIPVETPENRRPESRRNDLRAGY